MVDTSILLYALCCSVQGRLKVVLLCLRYVDTWLSELVLCLRGVRGRSRFKNKTKKKGKNNKMIAKKLSRDRSEKAFLRGQLRAEKWEEMPSMSSEAGEI